MNDWKELLLAVQNHTLSVEDALRELKQAPYAELDFAKIDLHRKHRQGVAEVIYGAGKTPEQIISIVRTMKEHGQDEILITRLSEEKAEKIRESISFHYEKEAGIGIVGSLPAPDGNGKIVIATGGTSDIPVAEEAAWTAIALGNDVERLYDVGVAGLHRLLSNLDVIMDASVIIVIAGMEGALASVVGGLCDCPVIAVPTSVGYGAAFEGMAALLSMMNSCAAGVSVVNIDNGFGAGFLASRINHIIPKEKRHPDDE